MKMIVGLLSLILSFASIASSGETKTFEYDGSQSSVELLLRGEKTHTAYRNEDRRSTCYRTEMVGYRTVCSSGGYGPRGPYGPRPYPGSTCYQQPIYRQVAYSCVRTVSIPYEVKDYDVEAKVLVDVTNLSNVATPGEKFSVTLHGDEISLRVLGSKKFIIVQKKHDLRARMSGSVKMVDGLYAVELVEAAPIMNSIDIDGLSLKNSVLNVEMKSIENPKHVGFSLKVIQHRRLASDLTIFNKDLKKSDLEITSDSKVEVNLKKLGLDLNDSKYSITARAFFQADGPVLNESEFDLKDSRTIVYNNRK